MKEKLGYPLALMVCMFKPPISTKPLEADRSLKPKRSQPGQKRLQGTEVKKIK
ncbi:MAG: hypothetical protein AAGB26_12250 [Planctomycetota bacterium]